MCFLFTFAKEHFSLSESKCKICEHCILYFCWSDGNEYDPHAGTLMREILGLNRSWKYKWGNEGWFLVLYSFKWEHLILFLQRCWLYSKAFQLENKCQNGNSETHCLRSETVIWALSWGEVWTELLEYLWCAAEGNAEILRENTSCAGCVPRSSYSHIWWHKSKRIGLIKQWAMLARS